MSKADSIKAKLKNIAVEQHKQFDYLLMLYFIERLLYRVSISGYSNAFVLKGGLLLYTILDEKARATKDVDFLARETANTVDGLTAIFSEICAISCDDAVIYDTNSIRAEKIKEDADYEGVRIKLTAFLDKSKKTLQFDIGFGDVIIPSATDMDYPSLLDMDKPKLKAYSLESVIAEKLEAMIYLAEANSRMKDFYDVYSLATKFSFLGEILRRAINETFKNRHTPLSEIPTIYTAEFAQAKGKQTGWLAFQKRIDSATDISFPEAMRVITAFTKPIYDSILRGTEFCGDWNCSIGVWMG